MVTGAGSARFTFSPRDDFAAALRAAANANPARDIVVLAPGVQLPFALDERLQKAAHAAPGIAAAVPMCDVSPIYALVDEARPPGAGRGGLPPPPPRACIGA